MNRCNFLCFALEFEAAGHPAVFFKEKYRMGGMLGCQMNAYEGAREKLSAQS
jgi:hypothetical protein